MTFLEKISRAATSSDSNGSNSIEEMKIAIWWLDPLEF